MAGGLQLVAISNLSKELSKDYSTLTAFVSNPPSINSLVPYIKITDIDSKRVLYDNVKWLHNPQMVEDADIILDLIDMSIEVGKNGFPSLIAGTVKFKILNANKFITKENDIRIPQLFSLLSYKNVQFGWNHPKFKLFNEDVIEMKFNTSSESQNTGIVTMHIGSPLMYFNKIENAFISKFKDTSKLNVKPRQGFALDFNGRRLFSAEVVENIIDSELSKGYNGMSYLPMFDNIRYDFKGQYSFKSYTLSGEAFALLNTEIEQLYGIENIFSKSYGGGGTNITSTPDGDLFRFDGVHHYVESWYSDFVDFSSFNPDDRTQLAIIPRLSRYIPKPRADIGDKSVVIASSLEPVMNDFSIENLSVLEFSIYDGTNKVPEAVPAIVEDEYYRKFLFDVEFNPFVRNYNFDESGNPILATRNRTIERRRLELLVEKHLRYILELREIAGELFNNADNAITPLEVKLKIRELYNELSIDRIYDTDDRYFINELLQPYKINVEELDFKQIDENNFVNPAFRIPTEDVEIRKHIRITDLVTLLELNYRARNQHAPFYKTFDWITYIQSLDNFKKDTGEDKKLSLVSPRTGLSPDISEKLVTIYDCMLFFATYISRWTGRPTPKSWGEAYYILMVDSEEDKIQINKDIEESQQEEVVDESEYDRTNLFSSYDLNNNLRIIDIVNDLNGKLDEVMEAKYQIQIQVYGINPPESPNLPDRSYELQWGEGSDRAIKFLGTYDEGEKVLFPGENRLEHLLIPKNVFDNQKKDSLFGILRGVFKHFSRHFNLNLDFSIYRVKGVTIIEIFCLDLITQAVDNWNGDTDFGDIAGALGDRFIALDYRSNNSIITKLTANVQTQDSLFLSFMPAQTERSIIALFKTGSDRSEDLSKEALDNLVKIYKTIFKPVTTENLSGDNKTAIFEGMFNQVQEYQTSNQLGTFLSDGKLQNDLDFLQNVIKFYNASGTYPAHLLFGGYTITLELIGLNGFASFQIIGLRNSGLYDGLYMIETASHNVSKTTFKTILKCKLLVPRIRAFSTEF